MHIQVSGYVKGIAMIVDINEFELLVERGWDETRTAAHTPESGHTDRRRSGSQRQAQGAECRVETNVERDGLLTSEDVLHRLGRELFAVAKPAGSGRVGRTPPAVPFDPRR